MIALVGMIIMTTSCSASSPYDVSDNIVIASGGRMGVYFGYANALSDAVREVAPALEIEVVATAGSRENLTMLRENRAACAFVATDAAAEALSGPISTPDAVPAIASVARVYDDYLHLVTRADGPVHSVGDLQGRRVSLGPATSGTRLIVDRLFEAAGGRPDMSVVGLGIDDSLAELEAGVIDAFFWSGGVPTTGVAELSGRLPLRIVPLDDIVGDLTEHHSAYRSATIPIGPYGNRHSVATIAVPNQLVCRSDLAAPLVEVLVDRLFAGRNDFAAVVPQALSLDRRLAIETSPVPLHPAARQWYRVTKP